MDGARDYILNSITKRRRPVSGCSIWDASDQEEDEDEPSQRSEVLQRILHLTQLVCHQRKRKKNSLELQSLLPRRLSLLPPKQGPTRKMYPAAPKERLKEIRNNPQSVPPQKGPPNSKGKGKGKTVMVNKTTSQTDDVWLDVNPRKGTKN